MANYTDEFQVKLIYGGDNIDKWANLDNTASPSPTVSERIDWACETATEYLNGRLALGRYNVPFATPPKIIILMSSMFAGLLLFDGRLVVSSEPPFDQMSRQRKDFLKYIRQLLSGQLRLIDAVSGDVIETTDYNAPFAVTGRGSDNCNCDYRFDNTFYCQGCYCHTCVCRSLTLPCW